MRMRCDGWMDGWMATMQVCHFTISTRIRPMVVGCPSTIHVCRKMSVCMRETGALALLIPYFDPAYIPKGLPRPSQRLRDAHSSRHSAETTVIGLCHGFIVPVVKLWVQRCHLLSFHRSKGKLPSSCNTAISHPREKGDLQTSSTFTHCVQCEVFPKYCYCAQYIPVELLAMRRKVNAVIDQAIISKGFRFR